VAIKGFGEQARGRRFTDAASAAEEIGVMQPLVLDCVAERARDGLLPRHFLKRLRTPFARDDLIRHIKKVTGDR
jgi:hypothetical protein